MCRSLQVSDIESKIAALNAAGKKKVSRRQTQTPWSRAGWDQSSWLF